MLRLGLVHPRSHLPIDEIPGEIVECFVHKLKLEAPDEAGRAALLATFLAGAPLDPRVSPAEIARKVAGMVPLSLKVRAGTSFWFILIHRSRPFIAFRSITSHNMLFLGAMPTYSRQPTHPTPHTPHPHPHPRTSHAHIPYILHRNTSPAPPPLTAHTSSPRNMLCVVQRADWVRNSAVVSGSPLYLCAGLCCACCACACVVPMTVL